MIRPSHIQQLFVPPLPFLSLEQARERVSERARLEMAYLMMSRPRTFPVPLWHHELLLHSRQFFKSKKQKEITLSGDSPAVVHVFNVGATKKALVAHGWMGSSAFMSRVIELLTSFDYEVSAVDLPCHGKSPGSRLKWHESVNVILQAQSQLGPFDLCVGHSYGGAMSLAATGSDDVAPELIHSKLETQTMVLIASPTSLMEGIRTARDRLNLSQQSMRKLAVRVSDLALTEIHRLDGISIQQQLKSLKRVLCLHDPKDDVVSYESSVRLRDALPNVKLKTASGLGHMRIVYDAWSMTKIRDFLQEQK
ncbi:MAG: alpha/beta fold hydrolase [Bdellovibrionales bacterium]|nr:alpha/beta fold hydrolase [Bdellovibrionales bacterium]